MSFVTDVYSHRIVGWNVASTLKAEVLPLQALEMVTWQLGGDLDGLVHHSDHGLNYMSMVYTRRVAELGAAPSTGTVGDSYDNSMAEALLCRCRHSSWDITKMRGPAKGCWYHAYVILDIFSRYVVGWRIENVEDGALAADLVEQAVAETGQRPGWLHADGGAAMTSKPLASLLSDLDITRSRSRPHTSNDNPYSEAQFKTMKYQADYPGRFESIGHARAWMDAFITSYNHEHYHSGIGYYTPASVHHGTAEAVRELRQTALDAAYAKHPERFARRPRATELPAIAYINDPARRRPEPAQPEQAVASHLI